MRSKKLKLGDKSIDYFFEQPPQIPAEWVEVIEKLHPITAVVIWAVLNNQVSGEIISLARYSPDLHHYEAVTIIAHSDLNNLEENTSLAQEELFAIFSVLVDNPRSDLLH